MMMAQIGRQLRAYAPYRIRLAQFVVSRSQRNPTPLFGAGLIDSIPESVIEAGAKVKYPGFPQIAGRVSRLKDKRIGRFGWKAQTASLSDFVLTACAVELGLEVPGHHQAGSPQHPDAKPTGFDLNAQECDSLDCLRRAICPSLPRSNLRPTREASEIEAGRILFAKVGCATCHVPKLGKVEGLYSDLLGARSWVRVSATSGSTVSSTPARPMTKSSMTRQRSPMRPPLSDHLASSPKRILNLSLKCLKRKPQLRSQRRQRIHFLHQRSSSTHLPVPPPAAPAGSTTVTRDPDRANSLGARRS